MKAVVKYAAGRGMIRLMDMPEPVLRSGHVIVEVEAAGICGTDLHIEADEYPANPPVILGHEFSGVVADRAPDVASIRPGQRVTCLPYFSTCDVCEYCRTGQWNLCAGRKSAGSGTHGAFARYVLMPERSVRVLPDDVDFVGGAMSEPLACCTHAVLEKACIKAGDLVVVLGPGSIGLLAAQVAAACGGVVVVVGTRGDEARLALARELGARHTVDVDAESAADLVKELTSGRGADVVLECSGSAAAARLGCELVKRRGRYVQIGLFGRRIELDWDLMVAREVDVANSFASTWQSWEYAMRLLRQGTVRTRPLVTEVLPLERWEEGFARFRTRQGIKVALSPKS